MDIKLPPLWFMNTDLVRTLVFHVKAQENCVIHAHRRTMGAMWFASLLERESGGYCVSYKGGITPTFGTPEAAIAYWEMARGH